MRWMCRVLPTFLIDDRCLPLWLIALLIFLIGIPWLWCVLHERRPLFLSPASNEPNA
jgi:hypothetical protein